MKSAISLALLLLAGCAAKSVIQPQAYLDKQRVVAVTFSETKTFVDAGHGCYRIRVEWDAVPDEEAQSWRNALFERAPSEPQWQRAEMAAEKRVEAMTGHGATIQAAFADYLAKSKTDRQ